MKNIITIALMISLLSSLIACSHTKVPSPYPPETAIITQNNLVISKTIIRPRGQYIVSQAGFSTPKGMIIQGFEVHYQVELTHDAPLQKATTEFTFEFSKAQGKVKFLTQQGGNSNYFTADWYGENTIEIVATDKSTGRTLTVSDSVFVDFASRRVLGGNAENLTAAQRHHIEDDQAHNINNPSPGMAYLPADFSRGQADSDAIQQGFYQTAETRTLKTSTGAILQTTQARRIGSNDAPPGQGIVVSRSQDHGASWHNEILLAQGQHDVWGYTGMVEVDGTLYIYMTAGHPSHQENNRVNRGIYYFTSTDDGKSWSQKIRHDQLSDLIGFTSSNIPRGPSITTNLLIVPLLSVDNVTAPQGQGLLMHTYAHGYIFASINGGKTWQMVADSAAYKNKKTNGYQQPIYLSNEIAWDVLDNDAQDIYAIFRRQARTGYKNEYVFSKNMSSGRLGITFKGVHSQQLKNLKALRAHHDMYKIPTGKHAGRLIFSTPGQYSRHGADIAITDKAINNHGVSSGMFSQVSLYQGLAWGQSGVVYLENNLQHTQGMGKDAIVVISESEPININNHQIINLKPNGKGKDERYTTSALIFSMDYFNALVAFNQQ